MSGCSAIGMYGWTGSRVGKESGVTFAGQSVVVDPYGNVVSEANDRKQLVITDIDLTQTARRECEVIVRLLREAVQCRIQSSCSSLLWMRD